MSLASTFLSQLYLILPLPHSSVLYKLYVFTTVYVTFKIIAVIPVMLLSNPYDIEIM